MRFFFYQLGKISQKGKLKQLNELVSLRDKKLALFKRLKEVKKIGMQNSFNEKDYQSHKIEIPLPEWRTGLYIFRLPKSLCTKQPFLFSPIQVHQFWHWLTRVKPTRIQSLPAIDRNHGKPISGATLKFLL